MLDITVITLYKAHHASPTSRLQVAHVLMRWQVSIFSMVVAAVVEAVRLQKA